MTSEKGDNTGVRALMRSAVLVAVAFGGTNWPIYAQNGRQPAMGGLQPILPTIPLQHPRPAEGPGADERWQIARPEAERGPVASLFESLKGNDTALEVVVGQARLLTARRPIAREEGVALIALGDPTVIDFNVPNPRMIRLVGRRPGVTDLSITTVDGQVYSFEVHVVYDLKLLRVQLEQSFPDAILQLAQIREHLVVGGEARSPAQVTHILRTLESYLTSIAVPLAVEGGGQPGGGPTPPATGARPRSQAGPGRLASQADVQGQPAEEEARTGIAIEEGSRPSAQAAIVIPQVINLIRVPTVQQVLLKVRVAELDRVALRQIGADVAFDDGTTFIETLLGNAQDATVLGIFDGGKVDIALKALRRNSVVTILAEPNLMALSGHQASFLAGGEFPVTVPQQVGAASTTTVEFKEFGVLLSFIPYVLDHETIRLSVAPEVSRIDEQLSVTLVQGGDPVPGLSSRRAETTVELRQGQTLAIAGLIQDDMDSGSSRIPFLGDVPYVGPLFSNTSHQRTEKELIVLVTPYLVAPMLPDQVAPLPGTEVTDPDDWEFYLLNRIEGRTGYDFRPTTVWDDALHQLRLEHRYMCGPFGFSK